MPKPAVKQRCRGPRRALTEDEILDAALNLLDDGGLDAASVRGIAARVGVAPNVIYTYFPDKEAVITALVERLLGEADHDGFADRERPWRERWRPSRWNWGRSVRAPRCGRLDGRRPAGRPSRAPSTNGSCSRWPTLRMTSAALLAANARGTAFRFATSEVPGPARSARPLAGVAGVGHRSGALVLGDVARSIPLAGQPAAREPGFCAM
jgi:AcrR family transcriptional regulator